MDNVYLDLPKNLLCSLRDSIKLAPISGVFNSFVRIILTFLS